MIDLTGKTWASKRRSEMDVVELWDAAETYRATGCELDRNIADGYTREWESRHGLPHLEDEEEK